MVGFSLPQPTGTFVVDVLCARKLSESPGARLTSAAGLEVKWSHGACQVQ